MSGGDARHRPTPAQPQGAAPRERFDGAMSALVQGSARVASLFDGGVAAAEYRALGDPAWLLPSERLGLGAVSGKRLAEFAAGRACARLAMQQLGLPRLALPPLDDRCPAWPATVAGSISHTAGFCAAIAASRERYRALGLDVEVVDEVDAGLWPQLMTAAEQDRLRALPDAQRQRYAALLFSAKEAFYKCQYAVHRQWFEFRDVAVELDAAELVAAHGRFAVRILDERAGMPARWSGRYALHARWILTGVALPA